MNDRERLLATIRFEKTDRPFRWEAPGIWGATAKRWRTEGFADTHGFREYFKMDRLEWLPFAGGWCNNPYCPMFDVEVVSEDEATIVRREQSGITARNFKEDPDTSMPQFIKFPVESAKDFEEHIAWRLDYTTAERFPENWDALCRGYKDRDYPLGLFTIGPFGYVRNLMGDDVLLYQFYDDPALIHRMMAVWEEFYTGLIERVAADVVPDVIMVWEDMCFRTGPLISPEMYREFLGEPLKRVIAKARQKGVTGIIVDNDGNTDSMIPVYLDCGANVFFPFEVQAGMDIVALRKHYGKRFAIIGGLDKRTLAQSEEAVLAEINAKVPFLIEDGGFIPMTDHTIPPNVPFTMFQFFVNTLRTKFSPAKQ